MRSTSITSEDREQADREQLQVDLSGVQKRVDRAARPSRAHRCRSRSGPRLGTGRCSPPRRAGIPGAPRWTRIGRACPPAPVRARPVSAATRTVSTMSASTLSAAETAASESPTMSAMAPVTATVMSCELVVSAETGVPIMIAYRPWIGFRPARTALAMASGMFVTALVTPAMRSRLRHARLLRWRARRLIRGGWCCHQAAPWLLSNGNGSDNRGWAARRQTAAGSLRPAFRESAAEVQSAASCALSLGRCRCYVTNGTRPVAMNASFDTEPGTA